MAMGGSITLITHPHGHINTIDQEAIQPPGHADSGRARFKQRMQVVQQQRS